MYRQEGRCEDSTMAEYEELQGWSGKSARRWSIIIKIPLEEEEVEEADQEAGVGVEVGAGRASNEADLCEVPQCMQAPAQCVWTRRGQCV